LNALSKVWFREIPSRALNRVAVLPKSLVGYTATSLATG
jgi:hypothetical protein